ncbi:MAG: hypothetical protein ACTSQE_16295, partial [Candidatus Heimdallarchaeaceae archaeon]
MDEESGSFPEIDDFYLKIKEGDKASKLNFKSYQNIFGVKLYKKFQAKFIRILEGLNNTLLGLKESEGDVIYRGRHRGKSGISIKLGKNRVISYYYTEKTQPLFILALKKIHNNIKALNDFIEDTSQSKRNIKSLRAQYTDLILEEINRMSKFANNWKEFRGPILEILMRHYNYKPLKKNEHEILQMSLMFLRDIIIVNDVELKSALISHIERYLKTKYYVSKQYFPEETDFQVSSITLISPFLLLDLSKKTSEKEYYYSISDIQIDNIESKMVGSNRINQVKRDSWCFWLFKECESISDYYRTNSGDDYLTRSNLFYYSVKNDKIYVSKTIPILGFGEAKFYDGKWRVPYESKNIVGNYIIDKRTLHYFVKKGLINEKHLVLRKRSYPNGGLSDTLNKIESIQKLYSLFPKTHNVNDIINEFTNPTLIKNYSLNFMKFIKKLAIYFDLKSIYLGEPAPLRDKNGLVEIYDKNGAKTEKRYCLTKEGRYPSGLIKLVDYVNIGKIIGQKK